jgi:transcriptional regulator with XRE-family HTH domain
MAVEQIRARIRQRLDALGLSMQAASKAAGLSEAYLKHFLAERQDDITVTKLDALAKALKTTSAWLLTGEGDPAVQPDQETADIIGIIPHLKKPNIEKARDYLELLRASQQGGKKK